MKQTAVEWLIEQMLKQGYFDASKSLTFTNLDNLQEQAKAMEKEQIIDAFIDGDVSKFNEYAEQYYLKTYKQD